MNSENESVPEYSIAHGKPLFFTFLLIAEIPSILCCFLILFHFIFNWRLMIIQAMQNHTIFLLTILSFLYITADLPFSMNTIRTGIDTPRHPKFCIWWYWFDYTIVGISLFLASTSSIQRHILIFHPHWLRFRRLRWFLHFMPLIFCLIYPASFYFIFMYLYSCETFYDPTSYRCIYPCYLDNPTLYKIDWLVNAANPVLINVIANFLLIVRVIYSRRKIRHQQRDIWKKQKKLTFNLLVYSLLYFLWFPTTVITLIQYSIYPTLMEDKPWVYYIYASCLFVGPLQPFMFLLVLPELLHSIKRKIRRERRAVAPTIRLAVRKTR